MEILPDTTLFYDIVGLLNEKFQISDEPVMLIMVYVFFTADWRRERERERERERALADPGGHGFVRSVPSANKKNFRGSHSTPQTPGYSAVVNKPRIFPSHTLSDLPTQRIALLSKQTSRSVTLRLKGLILPKILSLMPFQTRTTFVHLQNTSEDLFDEIWELSVPPLHKWVTLEKVHQEIINNSWAV